jgi:phosphate transport system substrate-binding protein
LTKKVSYVKLESTGVRLVAAVAAVAVAATMSACGSGEKKALKASGSTAQANAMTRFKKAYEEAYPGYTINYTASGSGNGVSEFLGNQTDFAGSDSPLNKDKGEVDKAKDRCGSDAWNLPLVFGPIAIAYNLAGVTDLVLDGPTLAKIFNGTVKTWDAPEIAALNPGRQLPSEQINVIFRSDESGTTDNFQKFLDAASDGAWGKGAGKTFNGGVGEGKNKSDGVTAAIKNTPNSITYVEWSFARNENLPTAQIVTSAGPDPVPLTTETAARSITGVQVKGQGNDLVLDTSSFYKPTEPGSYPIMLATYEIVCSKYPDSATGTQVKQFLTAALGKGQEGLTENGYVPLPDAFKSKLTDAANAVQ